MDRVVQDVEWDVGTDCQRGMPWSAAQPRIPNEGG
jgi:hypothetical protein